MQELALAIEPWFSRAEGLVREAVDLSALYPDPAASPEVSPAGKMVRVRLFLLAAEAAQVLGETAATLAAAVEMVHGASLVHDDVVDGASLRRGRTTLHREQGNRIAIMAGDVFFARAMELITRQDRLPVFRAVARGVEDLAAGQLAEAAHRGDLRMTPGRYAEIADRKTGGLLALCLEIPGILADYDPPRVATLRRAGVLLGRTFQAADDLLDLAEDSDETGKDSFLDLIEGKLTLPYLILLDLGGEAAELVRRHLGRPDPPRARIRELAAAAGLAGKVAAYLDAWLGEALALVRSGLPPGRAEALCAYCRTLAYRSR